jgi:hypothetical protein
VLLALGAGQCVPPAMRGDTASWLYIALVVQVIVPAWFAPGWLLALVALSRPAWEWITGALVVFATHAAVAYRVLGQPPPGPLDVAGLRRLVPATADWRATMDIGDAGAGFLAVRWRKAA